MEAFKKAYLAAKSKGETGWLAYWSAISKTSAKGMLVSDLVKKIKNGEIPSYNTVKNY